MDLATQLLKRESALMAGREAWTGWWQQLADHVMPRKAQAGVPDAGSSVPDQSKAAKLFDSTAMTCNQTLANGQMANITPMGAQWFLIEPPEGRRYGYEVRNWLHGASQALARLLVRSNFYSAIDEIYLDRGGFGTATILCRMGREKRLVFEVAEIGTYAIAEDEERQVDTLFRTYRMTPRQMVQRWGDELPADIRARAEDPEKADIPEDVLHAIEPRLERDPRRGDESRHMPVRSAYVRKETKEVLHETGFYERPFATTRWRLWGDSPWGWSPSWYALPTSEQLNFLEQCTDVGVERAAFPAWLIPATMKGEFDPRPHGQSIYDPRGAVGDVAMPRELVSQARLEYAVERAEQKREMIREAFFYDLFRMLSRRDKAMTAREVAALEGEKHNQFHPFLARFTTELLGPVLRRAFAEALRAGLLGRPPAELFERSASGGWEMPDPQIAFTSRLALTLQINETSGLLQTFETLAPLASVDPSVFDFIDTAKAGPAIARSFGVGSEIMRTEKEIREIQAARAEAAQQAAQNASGAVRNLGGAEGINRLMDEA